MFSSIASEVSVVIPVRNREKFVGKAIASALMQEPSPGEVVVVDDGSEDKTAALVSSFGDPVKLVRQSHQGRSVARNNGVSAAAGRLIAFLDSDDEWLPMKLRRQIQTLDGFDGAAAITGHARVISSRGVTDEKKTAEVRAQLDRTSRADFDLADVIVRPAMYPSSLLMPKSIFESVGGFDTKVEPLEDWDLMIRIAASHGFAAVPWPPIFSYRIHAGNTEASAIANAVFRVAEKYARVAGDDGEVKAALALVRCRSARALGSQRIARSAGVMALRSNARFALSNGALRLLIGSLLPLVVSRTLRREDVLRAGPFLGREEDLG